MTPLMLSASDGSTFTRRAWALVLSTWARYSSSVHRHRINIITSTHARRVHVTIICSSFAMTDHVGRDPYLCSEACHRRKQLHQSSVSALTDEATDDRQHPTGACARCLTAHTAGLRNWRVCGAYWLRFCERPQQRSCTTSASNTSTQSGRATRHNNKLLKKWRNTPALGFGQVSLEEWVSEWVEFNATRDTVFLSDMPCTEWRNCISKWHTLAPYPCRL